ncbi:angiotensin-converting enzyme-like isoform X1 [Leptidea sinapis]|uniref:angiotensin-converting enzyme-like isoform X1 n=1 Tax=Leptidea sinapis TaxID=189913 RepID=UPI002136A49B|nr:angiotensin-converting enzyme-like isoform X1 [Leptidea sinapis]
MMLKILGELALLGAIASVFVVAAQGRAQERAAEESSGREYMRKLDEIMGNAKNKLALASWDYESNITDFNEKRLLQISLEIAEEQKEYWKETMTYFWHEFEDEDLKRMFKKYSILGTSALPEDLNQRLIQAINNMKSTYAKATICDYKNISKCDLTVEPGVTDIFAKSQDPDELKQAWLEWHKSAGAASKSYFTEYVQMYNEAAKLNGLENVAEWWIGEYETEDIEDQLADLWTQVKPLYEQIHAYVRRHLRLKYGDAVSAKGPIPAHLLGNIWAQTWSNVEKFTSPSPDKPDVDVTAALIDQNYTPLKIFQTADEFFKSLNLTGVPDLFWERSIIEKPDDGRDMVCHASAWDFFDGEDFRIKQCTTITNAFFKTTHHELGHIQYYLQYKDQPIVYREGANPGFHEAVGDVIALSVSTPKHLKVMGLLEDGPEDNESNINQLYKMGLDKIVFLPFAYLLDLWRYGVFRGTTTPENYNCHFWQLRDAIQGIEPPAPRSEDDFDPAAKYHVSADVEYMRYYISYIVQFQFHRSLCQLADEYQPGDSTKQLSNCDIYKSTKAGNALKDMLKVGSSRPWPDAMEALTGQRNMDASGVMEYFQPLYDWLKTENERTGEYIGWEPSTVQYCTPEQLNNLKDSPLKSQLNKFAN